MDISVGFVALCGIQTIREKLELTFPQKFVSCFIEIQYQIQYHLLVELQILEPSCY